MTLSEVLRGHRSIRKYKPEPIPEPVVMEVCDEAIAGGSSSGNLNSVSMVLTEDRKRKKRLYELHGQQDFILEAPLVITFCADWYRTREWLRQRGARDNFNNLLGYHVAAYDAMILAQNVSLGFEARGYGICFMGTTLYALDGISELLQLPETVLPVTTITVGTPAEDPEKRDRLPTESYIHREIYQRPTPEDIDAIYREKEVVGWDRYMEHPRFKTVVDEYGITSLAQFYTSPAKYDPDEFANISDSILKALKAKKFFP